MIRKTADIYLGAVQKLKAQVEKPAVQKRADLVELEKCCKMRLQLQKIGFDTADNRPSKVWVTGTPVPVAVKPKLRSELCCERQPQAGRCTADPELA